MEEYLRFVLADVHLVETCKQLRHDLAAAVALIPLHELLTARDTSGDVGTAVTASDEYLRSAPRDIWIANQKRVEQSLRCLEEFSKPLFAAATVEFERIRYRMYTLAKATESTFQNRDRLAASRLYVLIDARNNLDHLKQLVGMLIEAGVHILQLREKDLADRELLERARAVREMTRGTRTLLIMNDRPDLAVLSDADGVHVGQDELRVADARAVVGSNRLVGVSTHSLQQARQAVLDGADYIGCGPVFSIGHEDFCSVSRIRTAAASRSRDHIAGICDWRDSCRQRPRCLEHRNLEAGSQCRRDAVL